MVDSESEHMKSIRNQNFESKDVVIPNDKKWSEKMSKYKSEKNSYKFNTTDFPQRVTHTFQKEQENSFNPITQRYTDNMREKSIRQYDKKTKIDDMSKGYDQELSLESTYNLINLRNKLKGLNYSLDKYIRDKKKLVFDNPTTNIYYKPYNIITNNSFKVQYFLPPEQRDKIPGLEHCNEGIVILPKKKKDYFNGKYYKDYNIISNNYKFFHNQKEKADREIQTLTSAQKLQNLQTYDIIKGKFINSEKEENYRKTLEQDQASKISSALKDKIKNKNYIVRNPLNNEVYDEEEQKKLDTKESERLEKFRSKYKIEDYFRTIDINNEEKRQNRYKILKKPLEYKIINDRDYNIINNTLFNESNRPNKSKKYKAMTDWEKLISQADEKNSTFNKKGIYKSIYDISDINENYRNFLSKRRLKLEELTPFPEDPIFKANVEKEKMKKNSSFNKTFNLNNKIENIRNHTIENDLRRVRNNLIYKFNNTSMNKKKFFETNTNALDYDNKDSIPVLVDRNINTRYFKNFLTKLRK